MHSSLRFGEPARGRRGLLFDWCSDGAPVLQVREGADRDHRDAECRPVNRFGHAESEVVEDVMKLRGPGESESEKCAAGDGCVSALAEDWEKESDGSGHREAPHSELVDKDPAAHVRVEIAPLHEPVGARSVRMQNRHDRDQNARDEAKRQEEMCLIGMIAVIGHDESYVNLRSIPWSRSRASPSSRFL